MAKLPRVTSDDVIKALGRDGWHLHHKGAGSHGQWVNPAK